MAGGEPSESVEAAVVGAGLAGLTCARHLRDAGHSTLVLEASGQVGGRVRNHAFADGTVVEVGGQWIGPSQDRIRALVDELGLETFPTHDAGDTLLARGGELRRAAGETPPFSPLVLADLAQATARLDRLARTVALDRPWSSPSANRHDAQTFETWLRRSTATSTARWFLSQVMTSILAVDPANLSLLHVLFSVHSGRGFARLASVRGGAQEERIVGGSQLVADGLVARLGDSVRLGWPVRAVEQDPAGVTVRGPQGTIRARRVVLAVPPTMAGRIAYDPPMPARRDQLTQRLPMGAVIKCQARYERPFWRDQGLSGTAVVDGPVSLVFDNSPPEGIPGVLVGFIEGAHAVALGLEPASLRRRVVLDSFVRLFGGPAASPAEYVDVDWAAEPWIRGCYGAHLPPGVWTQYGPALRAPVGRIHWAGTETATVWSGYMDGAVESGDRAAGEVLAALAGEGA